MSNEIRFYILESEDILFESLMDRFSPETQEKLRKFKSSIIPVLKVFAGIGLSVILFAILAGSASVAFDNYKKANYKPEYNDNNKEKAWQRWKEQGGEKGSKSNFEKAWSGESAKTGEMPRASAIGKQDILRADLDKQEKEFNRLNPDPRKQSLNRTVNKSLMRWFTLKESGASPLSSEEIRAAEKVLNSLSQEVNRDKEVKDFIMKGKL
jgi:hypothetical protein